jgi:hypothetical protein
MERIKLSVYQKRQRDLILRALTDPGFRKMLATDPAQALGKKRITVTMKKEIGMILAVAKGIDAQIAAIADELLCANGGPCGIA